MEAIDTELELKNLREELAAEKRRHAELKLDFATKLDSEADLRATQMVLQQQAVDADRAEQAKPKVLLRPSTWAELKSHDLNSQSKILALYGGEALVGELLKKRRLTEAALRAEEQDKLLAKHNRRIGPK